MAKNFALSLIVIAIFLKSRAFAEELHELSNYMITCDPRLELEEDCQCESLETIVAKINGSRQTESTYR